jgi:hypothetical protein
VFLGFPYLFQANSVRCLEISRLYVECNDARHLQMSSEIEAGFEDMSEWRLDLRCLSLVF